MKVAWSSRAIRHLTALRDHIAAESPDQAARVAERILQCVDLLTANPHIGRPGRILGTRELVTSGLPYVIPYRVHGERIELLAIFHGRQKWPSKL